MENINLTNASLAMSNQWLALAPSTCLLLKQSNAVEADEDMQGCIDGVSKEEKNVHDYYHMHILPTISAVSRPEPFQTWEACEMIQGCP